MIKRLICLIVTFVTVFALFGINKASALESNDDPFGPLVSVKVDFGSNKISSAIILEDEKENFLNDSRLNLNYFAKRGYEDIFQDEFDENYNAGIYFRFQLKENTNISDFKFAVSLVNSVYFYSNDKIVESFHFEKVEFNYINLTSRDVIPVDSFVIKIDNYLETTLMDDFGSFLVLNETADVYSRIYNFGCANEYYDAFDFGYEVGYTEGVRNNAETIIVKDNVPVDDNLIKVLIGLSGAVLLFGLIALCLFKMKKRRRK